MTDKIFEVKHYDYERYFLVANNKYKSVDFHKDVVFIASREECYVSSCYFKNMNLIMISDTEQKTITEINQQTIKEVLKFLLNNHVVDFKIVDKTGGKQNEDI